MSKSVCAECGAPLETEDGICRQCATNILTKSQRTPSGTITTPPNISGFTIERSLGEGGMGAVYLAEETTLRRRVAIKVISRRVAEDEQARARFLREARTLATIEHPHVVRVYTFGESDNSAYLVMEYVEGETLNERIARLGVLPVDDALRIARQIVDALEAAWEQKVIHRDIKPSNILIDRRGQVRVADFGLAKPLQLEGESGLTLTGYMLGTPHYVSPEQAQGQEVDHRSDIYSLGIMLYQMLAGSPPFEGTTPIAVVAKHLNEPLPSLRTRRAEIPEEVERLIRWMTAKDPKQRPESYAVLASALDALRGTTPSPIPHSFSTIAVEPKRAWWNPDLAALSPAGRIAALVAVAGIVTAGLYGLHLAIDRPHKQTPASVRDDRFAVAVAPFYGPDDDSAKEGRVMAALIERAVIQKLGGEARVLGIDETKTPVRDHDAARELGVRLQANAVIWGEAFALRNETELQPHVTVVAEQKSKEEEDKSRKTLSRRRTDDLIDAGERQEGGTLRLQSEAPNQIELRKTSASGIGDLALTLAGIHALQRLNRPDKALALFEQTGRSADTLRYRAKALLALDRNDEGQKLLEESLTIDPDHAPTLAILGDLHLLGGRLPDAIASYRKAAESGEPFTASRGIVFSGRLYTKESYRSFRYGNHDTNWLLGIEPGSLRVVERYALPGVAARFAVKDGSLQITCEDSAFELPGERQSQPLTLSFRDGRFDRMLWPPPSLRLRVRSIKAGRILATNFLEELEAANRGEGAIPPARFRPSSKPDPALPATLPDLETALRAAMERDATQPWHRFFLALALREQGRSADADAVFDELLRRDEPHVPYYDYAWMAALLERMRLASWADRLYPKIVAQRNRIPYRGPVTLIERLINAQFVRDAARNREIPRGHRVLRYARAITGPAGEGDDLAAATWARYFRRHGDATEERRERDVVRTLQSNPFNFIRSGLRADYTLALLMAGVVSFVSLVVALAVRGAGRARRARDAGLVSFEPLWSRVARRMARHVSRRVLIFLAALAAGILLVMAMIWWQSGIPFLLLVLLLPFAIFHGMRLRAIDVVASLTRAERRMLVVVSIALAILGAASALQIAAIGALAASPIGLADSIGSPRVVNDLEKRFHLRPGDDTRYAAAVANHYAGNRERAAELYNGMAHDERARMNAAALAEGALPKRPLTSEELARSFGIPTLSALRFEMVDSDFPGMHLSIAAVIAAIVLLLIMKFLPSRPDLAIEPTRKRMGIGRKLAMSVVPGLFDLMRGSAVRGAISLFAFLVTLPTVIFAVYLKGIPAGISPLGSLMVPNFYGSFPLPFGETLTFADRLTLRLLLPFGTLSAVTVAAAAITFLVLHTIAVVSLIRYGSNADSEVRQLDATALTPGTQ